MNPSHQAGNITAVIVWGYPIISYWTAYQGLKQEVASTKHWLFNQGWHQLFTALAHNRKETYWTAESHTETPPHLKPTERNTGGRLFVGWSWPFEVDFQTQRLSRIYPPTAQLDHWIH